ncbi:MULTISPECIES: hypothetical protein [Aneurinibacillus]|uniref:Uncharacterized protein n=1 Tax=Aneurinibacillus thermoaerophilus TaxID=143495 RepID=A0A1G8FLM6_ANETH|nr:MULTISPECIES: hypothetical protein [Aneurinibacillus]AMA73115.1 hypothetical protein ACH33_09745 [Aneurinibacillus sp. XH2]MED0675239.1 hypothetical protein [Aneurinibacillus thermoaerophilus]MED0678493.1 hypothetical protein [Aneurinibacillus thermoaerophilus]MED0735982.1 hypothetical protein [Aneurinibacillus thermoaerophilus]MED0759072.1 hypothetical protein [Aneurinibacillus thermoaerophilus]
MNQIKSPCNIVGLVSFLFLVFSIIAFFSGFRLFGSEWVLFYGSNIIGLLIGISAFFFEKNKQMNYLSKLGLWGNLAMAILFFPPFYFIWGTILFGP